jgi:acetyl/propionyl-CoA carboxylase alpha subunit
VVQQGKSKNKSIDRKPAITGAADKLKLAGENSLAERIQNSDLKINFLPLKGALGYNRQGEQNTIHIDSSLKGGSSETQSKLASVIAHEAKHNEGERRESKAHKAGENVYNLSSKRVLPVIVVS